MTYSNPPYSANDVLSVSIVTFHPDAALLRRTLSTLEAALDRLSQSRPGLRISLCLVDNGGLPDNIIAATGRPDIAFSVISGHGNVGYGRGHNLAIDRAASDYHLVLNPDIDLDADSLSVALDFLDAHPDVGLLSPRVDDERGRIQYLCRRYPALLDLLVRGFLPMRLRKLFDRRLAHYEMQDVVDGQSITWDPPIVSGCFMLFRTEALMRLGGFDPRYFLYFEDYDLSLRTHDIARVAYVPSVRVVHHGGGAARKGFTHIRMFAASAARFYQRFGWRLW